MYFHQQNLKKYLDITAMLYGLDPSDPNNALNLASAYSRQATMRRSLFNNDLIDFPRVGNMPKAIEYAKKGTKIG